MQKRVLFKRVLIGVVGFFTILVAAAVIIPFFINVDQYRPQIVEAANQHINGKLAIGKLSLSLWGQVEIDIDGITVDDPAGNKLVGVQETYAQISFLSILTGQPKLTFKMDQPEINIVKDKNGKINILGMVKEQPAGAQTPTPAVPEKKAESAKGSGDIPFLSMIKAAGLDVELKKANITFRDLASGFSQDVSNFNILLKDISMSRPMNLRIWADIVTKAGSSLAISGPLNIVGVVKPQFDGLDFKNVDVDLDGTFDDLVIDAGDAFKKAKGVATNFRTSLSASTSKFYLNSFNFKFHNAEIDASGAVAGLQDVDPVVQNFKVAAKPIDLSSWSQLIPALKDFELEGKMDLTASANGAVSKIGYNAKVAIHNLIAKAPGLVAKPKMQVSVDVVTDEVKELKLDFEAPGTDLAVRANVKSFSAPKINMTVNSNAIDLDKLLPPPAASAQSEKKTENPAAGQKEVAQQPTAPATDVDAALEPLRTNEALKKLIANVAIRLKKFNGYKVVAQDIDVGFSFKDLLASLDNFSVIVFRGLIKANASVDLKPKMPTYNMNLNVNNIDLQTAIQSHMESFKNTLLGQLSLKAQGNGKSLNSDQILKNLLLNGNFKVAEAKFASIDIGKMVVDGLNDSMKDIQAKVPALKDQKIKDMKNFKSKYKSIGGDFSLRGGVFLSQNFETVSYPKEGIDIKGRTEADLVNDKLAADWAVIDTYDMTQAREVTVDVNAIKVEHILAKGDEPVSFPVKVGCKLSAPCYDYAAIPKQLGEIALNNIKHAVEGRAKKEVAKVKEKAKEAVKKEQKKVEEKGGKELDKQKEKLKKRFGF